MNRSEDNLLPLAQWPLPTLVSGPHQFTAPSPVAPAHPCEWASSIGDALHFLMLISCFKQTIVVIICNGDECIIVSQEVKLCARR